MIEWRGEAKKQTKKTRRGGSELTYSSTLCDSRLTLTPPLTPPSFFLAETLKYLYMLQSPDHPISLAQYVFNTEAHPLKVFDEV